MNTKQCDVMIEMMTDDKQKYESKLQATLKSAVVK